MLRERLVGTVLFFAALGAWTAAAAGETDRLAPHRALYHLSLDRAQSGSGVVGVGGEMAIEWLRSCDGWTFEHKSAMSIEFSSGDGVRLATNATSWESLDGTAYRFSMRNLTGGKESDRIEGTASIERAGGPGEATLAEPKPKTFALPAGTLFPVAHTLALLRRAEREKPPALFSTVVFDGMGDEGPLNATATIGKMSRPEIAPNAPTAMLSGEAMWPVHVAYFPLGSAAPLPKQEIGMNMFVNGVADNLRIGFDDFVVRAKLARLEYIRPAACGR